MQACEEEEKRFPENVVRDRYIAV